MDDVQLAKKYGLFALPAIVHYEDGIPNVYDEDMTAEEVFSWLEDQKTGSYIEKVNWSGKMRIYKKRINFSLVEVKKDFRKLSYQFY